MPAGYSGTPLIRKLGIKPGQRVRFIDAPDDYAATLGPLPDGVTVVASLRGRVDVVQCFVTRTRDLERRLPAMRRAIAPDGMIWISWPKRASKVETDVTEDVVRACALAAKLVDVKVCAVDEVWSGLKLVIRKVDR